MPSLSVMTRLNFSVQLSCFPQGPWGKHVDCHHDSCDPSPTAPAFYPWSSSRLSVGLSIPWTRWHWQEGAKFKKACWQAPFPSPSCLHASTERNAQAREPANRLFYARVKCSPLGWNATLPNVKLFSAAVKLCALLRAGSEWGEQLGEGARGTMGKGGASLFPSQRSRALPIFTLPRLSLRTTGQGSSKEVCGGKKGRGEEARLGSLRYTNVQHAIPLSRVEETAPNIPKQQSIVMINENTQTLVT